MPGRAEAEQFGRVDGERHVNSRRMKSMGTVAPMEILMVGVLLLLKAVPLVLLVVLIRWMWLKSSNEKRAGYPERSRN
jgi:hypothetical protein